METDELIDYLRAMISPPGPHPEAVVLDLATADLASYEDKTLTGIILQGTPTPEQSDELMRILRPGAHLLVIAPDEEPTGHTGACNVEDAGFEIRDAILLIQEPERFHYVAKAPRAEREAGLAHLEGRRGHEAVERKEGSAGLNNPRAGAGRTADTVKNHHPTVKPKDIMVALLQDVPLDEGPVLDPFMGSGTTGIACVQTGHDFIGIEREAEYIEIADSRIRHWDMNSGLAARKIESDHKPKDKSEESKFFAGFDFDDL